MKRSEPAKKWTCIYKDKAPFYGGLTYGKQSKGQMLLNLSLYLESNR